MEEKPIRFTTHEVRATLDGRKTVTRRVLNAYELNSGEALAAVMWMWVIEFERTERPVSGE